MTRQHDVPYDIARRDTIRYMQMTKMMEHDPSAGAHVAICKVYVRA